MFGSSIHRTEPSVHCRAGRLDYPGPFRRFIGEELSERCARNRTGLGAEFGETLFFTSGIFRVASIGRPENCRIDIYVNKALIPFLAASTMPATPVAFDLSEGRVRAFQIALVGEVRDKYGIGDS